MTDAAQVTDNQADSRFEVSADGALAELIYRRRADRLVLVHTQVPKALGGRGVGGQLVRAALRKAAADHLIVVPLCPFARDWLERHPDEAGNVAIDWGGPFD
jgi:uncharacterized protein